MSELLTSELVAAVLDRREEHVAELLAAGAEANAETADGRPVIYVAAGAGDTNIVRLLLGAGAKPDSAAPDGTTVLMGASARGNVDVVRTLIAAGVTVDAQDQHGATALIYACTFRRLDVVGLLLESGADVHIATRDGRTAWSVSEWKQSDVVVNGAEIHVRGTRTTEDDPLLQILMAAGATRHGRL